MSGSIKLDDKRREALERTARRRKSSAQQLLEQAVDGVTRDVALYQQTSQQIRTYLQSVPTIYLPSHDPEAAHRLATRTSWSSSRKAAFRQ